MKSITHLLVFDKPYDTNRLAGISPEVFPKILPFSFLFILLFISNILPAQNKMVPPLPVEIFFGHERLGAQMVVKKPFTPQSKFGFFSVATYQASYWNELSENEMTIPVQFSYSLPKGFGIMSGTSINARSGFSPIAGPQHNFASRKILAVTVASFFFNEDHNLQIFGLYEYKPPINEKWSVYCRLQFIYNQSFANHTHARSYLQLRAGLKYQLLAFGVGTNLDRYGAEKIFKQNHGVFIRWEFK